MLFGISRQGNLDYVLSNWKIITSISLVARNAQFVSVACDESFPQPHFSLLVPISSILQNQIEETITGLFIPLSFDNKLKHYSAGKRTFPLVATIYIIVMVEMEPTFFLVIRSMFNCINSWTLINYCSTFSILLHKLHNM